MKFLVPNYSCLQNPWLGGYRPQIPILSVLNWICWPPPEKNSWVRHCRYSTLMRVGAHPFQFHVPYLILDFYSLYLKDAGNYIWCDTLHYLADKKSTCSLWLDTCSKMESQRVRYTLVWLQDLRKNGPINSSVNGNTTHKPQHHVNGILRDIMQTSICYSQNQPSTQIKRKFIVQQNELLGRLLQHTTSEGYQLSYKDANRVPYFPTDNAHLTYNAHP